MYVLAVPVRSGQGERSMRSLTAHTNCTAFIQREPAAKYKGRDGSVAKWLKFFMKLLKAPLVAHNLNNIFSKPDFSISFHNNKQC